MRACSTCMMHSLVPDIGHSLYPAERECAVAHHEYSLFGVCCSRMYGEMTMRKSQVLLAVLLLFLGLILCAFSVIVVFAVIQVVRSTGQVWVFPLSGGAPETHAGIALMAAWATRRGDR